MTTRRRFLTTAAAVTAAGLLPARHARPAESLRFSANPFSRGIASGSPTPDGMVLWTRLAPPPLEPGGGMPPEVVPVDWAIATDERMHSVVQHGTDYATPERATFVSTRASGLDAAC